MSFVDFNHVSAYGVRFNGAFLDGGTSRESDFRCSSFTWADLTDFSFDETDVLR